MRKFFKSIRWQIQAWYGLLLLVMTVGFGIFTYQLAWIEKGREIDRRLAEKRLLLVSSLRNATLAEAPFATMLRTLKSDRSAMISAIFLQPLKTGRVPIPELLQKTFDGEQLGHYYYRITDSDGSLILQSANAPAEIENLPIPKQGGTETTRWAGKRRERVVSQQSGLQLVIGQEISHEMAEMNQVKVLIGEIGLGVWLLGLLGGWIISGYAIRPIRSISESAVRISEGNLSERIQSNGFRNELSDLASILNTTFSRLQDAFKRQRQFTVDASHELRTPLTVILSETQRMQKKARSAEEYQDSIEICHSAGTRMKKLVEDLLLMAREDSGDVKPQWEPCRLDNLLSESIASMQVLTSGKGITIHVEAADITFQTDSEKLLIVFNNIIGNAIYHHHGNGNVWVTCHCVDAAVRISIKDDGPGIAEADLPHIFERFYRADTSRSPGKMHSGLGLAVCRTIVSQLNGTLEVRSEVGEGSEFTLQFPLEQKTLSGGEIR